MKLFSALVFGVGLVAVTACGGGVTATESNIGDRNSTIDTVQVIGPLRLEGHDMPLMAATVPFDPPSVTATNGAVVATNAQYGSLCAYDLTGRADVGSGTIGVHVILTPRLTMCTADVRVLAYTATVSVAPGTYDVAFVRELNNEADTLARTTVTVR
jgi:hypothetical protein